MGFLNRLFGRRETSADDVAAAEPECPHTALAPHWESVEDIGHSDRVTGYRCDSCGAVIESEEGEKTMTAAASRLTISEEERRDRLAS
jgi:hypothetical protein